MDIEKEKPAIIDLLTDSAGAGDKSAKNEILEGLKNQPKRIPSKFFYDGKGSGLFEAITTLPEYYPTRCEKEILTYLWDKLELNAGDLRIIELGSGDCSKIRLLLTCMPEDQLRNVIYYPVDISPVAIRDAIADLKESFPTLKVKGIAADFTSQLHLLPRGGTRMFCFFGSTIGNLDPGEINGFMTSLGREMVKGDHLLMGLDMIKDISVLENAYNDNRGVTAMFNKNILSVANELLESDFDPGMFDHKAFYNQEKQRIEMHLQARRNMSVSCNSNGSRIKLKEGETIHTENSHKFSPEQIEQLGEAGGLGVKAIYPDSKAWFGVVHFVK